jgi:hypothetical protein
LVASASGTALPSPAPAATAVAITIARGAAVVETLTAVVPTCNNTHTNITMYVRATVYSVDAHD